MIFCLASHKLFVKKKRKKRYAALEILIFVCFAKVKLGYDYMFMEYENTKVISFFFHFPQTSRQTNSELVKIYMFKYVCVDACVYVCMCVFMRVC